MMIEMARRHCRIFTIFLALLVTACERSPGPRSTVLRTDFSVIQDTSETGQFLAFFSVTDMDPSDLAEERPFINLMIDVSMWPPSQLGRTLIIVRQLESDVPYDDVVLRSNSGEERRISISQRTSRPIDGWFHSQGVLDECLEATGEFDIQCARSSRHADLRDAIDLIEWMTAQTELEICTPSGCGRIHPPALTGRGEAMLAVIRSATENTISLTEARSQIRAALGADHSTRRPITLGERVYRPSARD